MGNLQKIPSPDFSAKLSIILVEPKIDGNIGAVARSMLNFGVQDLRIVGHDGNWSSETRNRAKNAQIVLDNCTTYNSLDEAVSDLSIVIGTSGKRELGSKTTLRHFISPSELTHKLIDTDGQLGVIFGPEGFGLLNDQLSKCDLLMTIPSWEGYPILNLSHAVSIVCYNWYTTNLLDLTDSEKDKLMIKDSERLLSPELRKILKESIANLSNNMPTKEHRRQGIEEVLTRVIFRGLPLDDEIHRIIGVVNDSQLALKYMSENPEIWDEYRSEN